MSKSRHTEAEMIVALKQLEAGRKAEDVGRPALMLTALTSINDKTLCDLCETNLAYLGYSASGDRFHNGLPQNGRNMCIPCACRWIAAAGEWVARYGYARHIK